MKKLMFISLLSAILFTSVSCKKDKEEKETTAVSVKFDGTVWTADQSAAVYVSATGMTTVIASSGLSSQLQIFFKGNSTGTYNFTTEFTDAYCLFANMNGNMYTSVAIDTPVGQIIVTKYDQEKMLLSGTFYFTGINSEDEPKLFSEGVFTNVMFENQ